MKENSPIFILSKHNNFSEKKQAMFETTLKIIFQV